MYNYFIVGSGLAGICFAETIFQNNKTAFVFDKGNSSSEVAAGVFNAVILKRFTLISNAQKQINLVKEFYPKIEKKIQTKLIYDIRTYRRLSSFEEQNNFVVASDKPLFRGFLSSEIVFRNFESVTSPFGFGQMNQTGYVDTPVLISRYKGYLKENNCLSDEIFDFSALKLFDDYVEYKGKKAEKIIFCEGFGMKSNPFFSDLPLDGVKGELLLIKSKQLNIDVMIKSDIFILPVGEGLYKVGATYNWNDKTVCPTKEGREELLDALKKTIDCDFEVVEHLAGIRPTVKDRKPLVGRHFQYKNVYILNGLGTRGVMQAPYLAQNLFDFIEFAIPLENEIDVKRIYKKNKIQCE